MNLIYRKKKLFLVYIFLVNTVENLAPKKSEKCFLSHNQSGKGFVWSELPNKTASEREEVCHVMYAALTSQDQYKDQTQTGMGKEFSGVTSSGRRVMGVHCPVSSNFDWIIL